MNYLIHGDNVELLNILSIELNDFNWFEAYSNDFVDLEVHTKEELMGIENSASMIIHGSMDDLQEGKNSSQDIIDINVFKPEVRSKRGDALSPQALMNHLHEGITPYIELSFLMNNQ